MQTSTLKTNILKVLSELNAHPKSQNINANSNDNDIYTFAQPFAERNYNLAKEARQVKRGKGTRVGTLSPPADEDVEEEQQGSLPKSQDTTSLTAEEALAKYQPSAVPDTLQSNMPTKKFQGTRLIPEDTVRNRWGKSILNYDGYPHRPTVLINTDFLLTGRE